MGYGKEKAGQSLLEQRRVSWHCHCALWGEEGFGEVHKDQVSPVLMAMSI